MNTPNDPHSGPAETPDMRTALLSALRWQVEMGADIALLDDPIDRTQEVITAPAQQQNREKPVPKPAALKSPAPPRQPDGLAASSEVAQLARQIATAADTLEALEAALQQFDDCPLKKTAKNLVFCDGNPNAKIMLVGEAPGRDEDIQGKPFVGQAGQLLDKMLAAIDLDRTQVYIGNCVQWRPPGNRKPTDGEKAMCLPFITRQIELMDPDMLVFVGGTAAQTLLGTPDGITRLRGRWQDYKTVRTAKNIPALPIFHPAFLLRTPARKRETWADLLSIKKKMAELGLAHAP
ncbi:MAG: uracil-DNA glycosylase family protein [Alphaproteobacteria bacterium]